MSSLYTERADGQPLPWTSALASLSFPFIYCLLLVTTCFAQPVDRRGSEQFTQAVDHFNSGLFAVSADEFYRFRNVFPEHANIADALYYEGEARLALGATEDAIGLFTEFESRYPNHPFSFQARLALGQFYLDEGNLEDAIQTLQLVLDQNPTDEQAAKALYWMGKASLEHGEDDEALAYFRRASDDYRETETAPRAAYALAFHQVQMGRYEEASRSFEELAARYPNSPFAQNVGLALAEVYYEINDFERTVVEIERRLPNLNGDAEDRAVFLLAESFNQLRNSRDAILNYRRFTEGDPANPYYRRALYGLAWNYHHEGSFEWAADNFRLVRESGDDNLAAEAMYYEAVNRKLEQKLEEAAGLFETFATGAPDHPLAANGWFELGILRYQLNNWTEANRAFGNVIELYPQSELVGEALLHRGNTFIALGSFDDALDMFNRAIELETASPSLVEEIIFQKAWLLYRNRRYRDAAPAFLDLFEQHPASDMASESLFWAAESYFQLENYARARSLFQSYLRDYPGARQMDAAHYALGWTYFKQRNYEAAIPEFESFLASYQDETGPVPYRPDARLRLADSFFALKRYPEAVRVYGRMAGDGDDYALYQIGQAYSNAGDTFEAIATLRRLLEEFPVSEWREESQYSLGYLYFLNQDYEQAVASYKQLISTYPRDPLAAKSQYGLGDAYFNEGNLGAAVDAYNAVLVNYPGSPFTADAAAGIQFSLLASGQEELADSLINSFAAQNPNSPIIDQLMFRQAEVKYQTGRIDESFGEFERFIEDAVRDDLIPQANYYLGIIYADRGNNDQAMAHLRLATSGAGDGEYFEEAAERLGHLLLESREYEESETVFRRMEASRPDDPGVVAAARYGRSLAMIQLGQSTQAEALLQEAIDADPYANESLPAHLGLARIRLQRGEILEAEATLEFIVNQSRDEFGAEALYLLGTSQLDRGAIAQAVESLGRMPALYGGYADWLARSYLKQAEGLLLLGNPAEAIRLYDLVQTLYPGTEFSAQAAREKARLQQ